MERTPLDVDHLVSWLLEELDKPAPGHWSDEYAHGYDDALHDLVSRLRDHADDQTAEPGGVEPWTSLTWMPGTF